ncbi:TonB-dependent receptor [Maricaulaceae bacterium NA33B04]|nr:TonB-dependent receptor [Maricaulaceae bacterium NA33B04]
MRLKAHLLACAALTAVSTPAIAQTEAATPATTDVIIVTTQKREQSLADVPINLTAFNSQRLSELGIEQFDDLSDFVPGLEVQEQSPNNPGFVIRGITSDDGAATGEARVAVFQDGVSISRARSAYVELFDIERVEVAKGPQATLFGRGALIGGINVIQNKAQIDEQGGSAEISVGDYNRFELRGHYNMPITDTVALRFAGVHKQRDGYVENVLGGEAMNGVELSAYRVSGRWAPSDALTVDVIANYQTDTPEGGTSFKSGAILPAPGGSLDPWEPAALNTFGGFEGGAPLGIDRQVYGVTILTDYIINDAWSLSSISGWRGFESVEIFDPDGFGAELLVVAEDASGRQWSQEFRFNYDAGGPVTGFFGGSYFYESGSQRIPLATNEVVAQAFIFGLDPATAPTFSLGFFQATGQILPLNTFYLEETANRGETTALDLFGDVSYAVNDRLSLTAGLRWTREEKEASLYGGNLNGVNNISFTPTLFLPATPNNGSPISSGTREFDDFTWRMAAQYDVSDTINAWVSYARGRRPDVISFDSTDPNFFVEVPAELVDSYEIGAFWTYDSTTLQGSVFYSEYQNFQTGRFEPNNAVFITDNAGQATQYGVELELNHRFNEMTSLFASYGYNFSEFDDTDENGNPQEFAGNTFRLSPDHAVSVGLLTEFDLPIGRLSIIPTWTWQSEVFFDNDNDLTDAVQDETQTDYGIVDLRVRLDAADDRFYMVAFVENLLDEEFIIDAGNTGDAFGIPTFIAGSPRMVGLRVGTEF